MSNDKGSFDKEIKEHDMKIQDVKIIADKNQEKNFNFFQDSFLFLDYKKIYGIKDALRKNC